MFPAMIIVPTLQIAWTLFSIVSGMLYFQEYRGLSALDASMFALGVTVRRGAVGRGGAGGAGREGKGAAGGLWGWREGRREAVVCLCAGVLLRGRQGGRLVWQAVRLSKGRHVAF